MNVPYVTCTHCRVANYVPLSYQRRGERCPACDEPLGEQANAVSPSWRGQLLTVIGPAAAGARGVIAQPLDR